MSSYMYKLISPDSAGESKDLLEGKNSGDAIRRIQALLAEWLRMENVVVLTAAGCSYESGGALMWGPPEKNLECLVLDAVERCDISDTAKAIIEWRRKHESSEVGFEEWLSFIFNASSLSEYENSPIHSVGWYGINKDNGEIGVFPMSSDDRAKLKSYIEKAIFCECALELSKIELTKEDIKASGHIAFLAKLIARDVNLGRTHLFTLNYDTLFEQALEELGIQYFDGFSGKASAQFDPAIYGLDIYYPGDVAEGRVRRFDKFLQFYKLHGSIHWYVENGIHKSKHKDFELTREYRKSNSSSKAKKLMSKEYEAIQSFGILPTSQKFIQTLDMPYAHLFRLFHARLNQPQTFLLVLGYGFGDSHVTRLIETALMNPSLVMLVVEPNPNSPIIERISHYQSLGQRIFILTENIVDGKESTYETATFSDFAHNVMPDVKWLEDFKNLRKFEEQIRSSQHIEDRKAKSRGSS